MQNLGAKENGIKAGVFGCLCNTINKSLGLETNTFVPHRF
jgi:hypothetical protein